MLKGNAVFTDRMCKSQLDSECLVNSVNSLNDPAFASASAELPGTLFQYYSLYEIYNTAKLSQCILISQGDENNTSDYLCKVHIVGFDV